MFLQRNVQRILIHVLIQTRTHIAMNLHAAPQYVIHILPQLFAKQRINLIQFLNVFD